MTVTSAPRRLSVVVIGYAPGELLAQCMAALRAQISEFPDVEVVVVAHAFHQGSSLAAVKAQFPEFTWIDVPPEYNVARMRGLGFARSEGAVVALLEGDCVPATDWLRQLTRISPAPAVGGAVEPGDFHRSVDWAAYFCEFAKFMLPLPAVVGHLPGANVVYARASLPDSSQLAADGFYETFVNARLGEHTALRYESALVVRNERTWRTRIALATRFHHGRGFAALRVRGRPVLMRLPYLALAAILPLILVSRVLNEVVRRKRFVGCAVAVLPWIIALSVSWALGEFAGYVAGPGTSLDRWR